jgi:predicted SprT family Zn-dependent metalloprotease
VRLSRAIQQACLAPALEQAHGPWMSEPARRTCQCGAIYARNEAMAAGREISSYQCVLCDRTLESWNTTWVPTYRLVMRPVKDGET